MTDKREIGYRVQYCQGEHDITTGFYAADDAELVRFWEDDYCLIEVTRDRDAWVPSGGDGSWLALHARRFAAPIDALRAYLPAEEYTLIEVTE